MNEESVFAPMAGATITEMTAAAAGAGGGEAPDARDLRLLGDINVELSVELGRSKLPIRDLLALTPGSVLDLERTAEAPVDILVNGTVVARGEVVVVDGTFAVRVTELGRT